MGLGIMGVDAIGVATIGLFTRAELIKPSMLPKGVPIPGLCTC